MAHPLPILNLSFRPCFRRRFLRLTTFHCRHIIMCGRELLLNEPIMQPPFYYSWNIEQNKKIMTTFPVFEGWENERIFVYSNRFSYPQQHLSYAQNFFLAFSPIKGIQGRSCHRCTFPFVCVISACNLLSWVVGSLSLLASTFSWGRSR